MELMNYTCPECGKELQIPAELESFSCLYCGARLEKAALLAPELPESERGSAFEEACRRLPGCVLNFRGYQKKITRDGYEDAFADVTEGSREAFTLLNSAQPDEEQLRQAANSLIDALEPTWKHRYSMDDDKILIAIFLVPAVRSLNLPVSEPFCETLRAVWVERFPKSPFYLAQYEDIAGGFRKRFCFITTAVCRAEGKADDCAELTAFRAFRDVWLAAQPDGQALIDEYYRIAPGIVACIDLTQGADAYAHIRSRWLEPCYQALQEGRMDACRRQYTDMVQTLRQTYLS